ncbi:MAG: flagellar hook-associated protein FlgK [Oscillospiraceae bacterium]|jgi:flagellar hook-associated protein 1 FlgK|nr:flagellar hook-associated protein FlgK [Oscillospiraceae bacterium]
MHSTFGSLNIANTGINIAQRQIDVTAHNISNANVEGYSRQRYINSAFPAMGWNVQFVPPLRGKEGNGVETLSLDQIRDLFLDRQFRGEQTKATYWETRSGAMYYIEDVFNSIDSNSLDGVLASFFNALQELTKNATDEAIRTNVVSEAKRLIDVFHVYDQQLTSLMEQQNFMLKEKVKHTNQLLTQMATLNDNIFRFELGGSVANDLRDKRALILDELSSIMDISYEYVPFEPPMHNIYGIELTQLKVYAGGNVGEDYEQNLLVRHFDPYLLKLQRLETGDNEIYDDLVDLDDYEFDPPFLNVFLTGPGVYDPDNFDLEDYDGGDIGERLTEVVGYNNGQMTGILQSYVDVRDRNPRDGSTLEKTGIPYYLTELNRMVTCFVNAFNAIHNDGYTMPYEGGASVTGVDFFDPDGLRARTIALSEEILLRSFNIAASSEMVIIESDDEGAAHSQTGNNEIALRLIKEIKEGLVEDLDNTIEGFYKNFLGTVASEASAANGMQAAQEVLLHGIHTQRTAVSSVGEDEEMTNMIRFQHAYSAASRCITTIDEMLDKLINGTGRVGLV